MLKKMGVSIDELRPRGRAQPPVREQPAHLRRYPVHTEGEEGPRALASSEALLARPQLHRHRAPPARPHPRGRGRRGAHPARPRRRASRRSATRSCARSRPGTPRPQQAQPQAEEQASTPKLLDQFGRNLTQARRRGQARPGHRPRRTRSSASSRSSRRRTKNNPVLIGEPGVGKTAIVEGLAQTHRRRRRARDCSRTSSVVTLDLGALVAGTKYRGAVRGAPQGGHEGDPRDRATSSCSSTSSTRSSAPARPRAPSTPPTSSSRRSPAASSSASARRRSTSTASTSRRTRALERRFQPIMVDAPTRRRDRSRSSRACATATRRTTASRITDEALEAAVDLSDRYITDRFLPDKAIDLIDEAGARVRIRTHDRAAGAARARGARSTTVAQREGGGDRGAGLREGRQRCATRSASCSDEKLELETRVEGRRDERRAPRSTRTTIAEVVAMWTGIPVHELDRGGDRAAARAWRTSSTSASSARTRRSRPSRKAIRRARAGPQGPAAARSARSSSSGPPGVGKTELAKALAEFLFGDEDALIQHRHVRVHGEAHRLAASIGSPPGYVGYEEGGQLTETVRRKPYSRGPASTRSRRRTRTSFNILLQILEDGRLTDALRPHGRLQEHDHHHDVEHRRARSSSKNAPLGLRQRPTRQTDYDEMKDKVTGGAEAGLQPRVPQPRRRDRGLPLRSRRTTSWRSSICSWRRPTGSLPSTS
ncbi:MAG: AAA family ATPase [Bacillus subtilis]|nr:AAA family ATPase [Bacillus subtilis]